MAADRQETTEERRRQILREDLEDLRAVLTLRFGAIPDDIEQKLARLQDIEQTNRLVLVAANAPDMDTLRREFASEIPAFRILSGSFEQRPQ
jgi:hypothetical protein